MLIFVLRNGSIAESPRWYGEVHMEFTFVFPRHRNFYGMLGAEPLADAWHGAHQWLELVYLRAHTWKNVRW